MSGGTAGKLAAAGAGVVSEDQQISAFRFPCHSGGRYPGSESEDYRAELHTCTRFKVEVYLPAVEPVAVRFEVGLGGHRDLQIVLEGCTVLRIFSGDREPPAAGENFC